MIVMFDSVTVGEIPSNAPAVAGYVGGRWPTFRVLAGRFPKAHRLSIAVNAGEDAECLDVEAGDAVPAQAPVWVRRQMARGVHRPVVYSSVSQMPAVLGALSRAGISRTQVRVWTAHFTFSPHLCGPKCGLSTTTADATQWTDKAFGRSLDESVCSDSFFTPPAAVDPYARFPNIPLVLGKMLHERASVREYDQLIKAPARNHARLAELHSELVYLRKRVWFIAHHDRTLKRRINTPRWSDDSLGWRWQQLRARTK